MPVEVIKASDALRDLGKFPEARWPTKESDAPRITPYAIPKNNPGFVIAPNSKIFTIGSCFARNIEKYLTEYGFELPAMQMQSAAVTWHTDPLGVINKYTPHSMLNEMRWALTGQPFPDPDGFLQESATLWIDPQLPIGGRGAELEEVRKRRAVVEGIHSQIKGCEYLIMTLGLAEAWWDDKTGLYLNRMPPKFAINREPERFALHVLSFADIVNCFDEMHSILRRAVPQLKILMTVSPVPFAYSFRNRDALVANMYSKSVLRAAVDQIISTHSNVDYFPSYEAVMLSERGVAWKDDRLHVADKMVGRIVDAVLKSYVKADAALDVKATLAEARSLALQHRWEEIKLLLEPLGTSERFVKDTEYLLILADAYFATNRKDLARKFYQEVIEIDRSHFKATFGLGRCLLSARNFAEAVPLLTEASRLRPEAYEPRFFLARAYKNLGNAARTIELLEKIVAEQPRQFWAMQDLATALRHVDPGRSRELMKRAKSLRAQRTGHETRQTSKKSA